MMIPVLFYQIVLRKPFRFWRIKKKKILVKYSSRTTYIFFSPVLDRSDNTFPAAWGWNAIFVFLFLQHLNTWSSRHMNIGTLALSALDWSFISALPVGGEGVVFNQNLEIYTREEVLHRRVWPFHGWRRRMKLRDSWFGPWFNFGQGVMTTTCTCFLAPRGAGCRPPWARPCLCRNSCLPSCWSVAQRWSRERGELAPQVQVTWMFLTLPPGVFFIESILQLCKWAVGVVFERGRSM